MSAINTSQDFVKGLDFTAINPQTADQHNQLVDLASPLGITSNVGIGLVLTTTDTASNTPDVPNPTASAAYNKWKRYVWCRRPFAGETNKTSKMYGWNDDVAVSDATYLKWQLIDPASNTTVGGGADTPLQTAIDDIDLAADQAVTSADAAAALVAVLQKACIGESVNPEDVSPDLLTQLTTLDTTVGGHTTDIDAIITKISGDPDDIDASGGINQSIANLTDDLATLTTNVKAVSNLSPAAVAGSMIRTNSNATGVEWYDPTDAANEIVQVSATGAVNYTVNGTNPVTLDAAKSLQPGTYKVSGCMTGWEGPSGTRSFYAKITVGAATLNTIKARAESASSLTLSWNGIIVVPAGGALAIAVSFETANAGTSFVVTAGDQFMNIVFQRISAKTV